MVVRRDDGYALAPPPERKTGAGRAPTGISPGPSAAPQS